jgi:death-on-curing protein
MSIVFVRADVLRNVHDRLIERYGGVAGVRDENALESAVGRPRNIQTYTGVTSIPHLAATLPWAILRNHPFADGNKRTAFAALTIFLDRNGYELKCTEVEETGMILRAAASEITEEQWIAWVERVAAPLAPQ